jgi:hypothetical protein
VWTHAQESATLRTATPIMRAFAPPCVFAAFVSASPTAAKQATPEVMIIPSAKPALGSSRVALRAVSLASRPETARQIQHR